MSTWTSATFRNGASYFVIMTSGPELAAYYAARAAEYERVYDKPERRADVARLREIVPPIFRDRNVLEVACGTGYWTPLVARHAVSVVATDVGEEVMSLAKQKRYDGTARVEFRLADAFDLSRVAGEFDAAFAGFWWSHVLRSELPPFVRGLNSRLTPHSIVMFIDNRYVDGSNYPITRTDAAGNTYQQRTLEDGAQHEVLKNFPTPAELRGCLEANGGAEVKVTELEYYWYAVYRTM
jgi:2-polyprenyl-3-methyl-5-hydroxy-6-metoxy-1,4-benzoquinol methylase